MIRMPIRRATHAVPFLSLFLSVSVAAQATKPLANAKSSALAGMYDGSQMEVAAQLLLKPDGHFQYELAYGALDEAAEGTWEFHDGAVFLTTVPAAIPPRFVVESDTPEPMGGLWIKVSNGPLMQGARQRIYLIYGLGEPAEMSEVADDGSVPFPDKRRPTAVVPVIPVYPIHPPAIPLTGSGGHRIVLRFEPHDIGKANFRAERLAVEDGMLVMPRRDLELLLHFRRHKP